jgi:hypothetical protein
MLIILVRVIRKLEGEKASKPKYRNDTGADRNRPIRDTEATDQSETTKSNRHGNGKHHEENK